MIIAGLWLENLDDVFQSLVFPIVPREDLCKACFLQNYLDADSDLFWLCLLFSCHGLNSSLRADFCAKGAGEHCLPGLSQQSVELKLSIVPLRK